MLRKKLQTVALTAAGVVVGLIVVCGVLIFLGGGQSAAAQRSASDLPVRAYLPLIANSVPWIEVARSPGLENGWQTLGRWRRVSQGQGGDAYPGCISASDPSCVYHPYEPTTGSNASWWTVGYNDSAWSAQGYVDWNSAWTTYGWTPIATIGEHVWKAEPGWPAGATDLHRRTFEIPPDCSVHNARLTLFSDNHSRWYINGTLVVQSEASASRLVSIPIAPFHSGSNLLAVQVNNDHVTLTNNPFGIQYILEVQLLCIGPTPTPTSTPTSTPTNTPTPTATNTPTSTPTNTPTPTPTTPTSTPTNTSTPTPTNTPTSTPTNTPTPKPEIRLSKSASPTTYSSAGEIITYTYIVTNTGDATLNGPVMVNDDRLGTFACGPAADLIPGASVTCTRTYVIQSSDLGNVLHLPIQQLTNVTYGDWLVGVNSTMDVILSGNAPGSDVPNGTYAGWCIEELLTGSLYDQLATLYTSTHLNLPSDVASLPWGKVNYILNHKIRGIGKTDGEFFKDVQTAIWVVLGEPIPTWGISFDAQQMINAANANPGYVPGLTDTVAVIVYSDGINSTGSDTIQEVIIEAKLGQITNHATATATVGGITVTSNPAEVTIRFVPVYNAVTIKLQNRPAVKSKS